MLDWDGKDTYGPTAVNATSTPLSSLQFRVRSTQGHEELQPQLSESISHSDRTLEEGHPPKQ
ncbi:hypothetical protein CVT26_012042 [Gymnopilus dilepis]|uniref:Uncharacterized protein n=1 Tax=Gymnopilus dilepis TaxID=231916 RepID=A0A409VYG1_9AGAR|nr:hypothetical protein CVT26_012042 [Gymnopilus dilepis]